MADDKGNYQSSNPIRILRHYTHVELTKIVFTHRHSLNRDRILPLLAQATENTPINLTYERPYFYLWQNHDDGPIGVFPEFKVGSGHGKYPINSFDSFAHHLDRLAQRYVHLKKAPNLTSMVTRKLRNNFSALLTRDVYMHLENMLHGKPSNLFAQTLHEFPMADFVNAINISTNPYLQEINNGEFSQASDAHQYINVFKAKFFAKLIASKGFKTTFTPASAAALEMALLCRPSEKICPNDCLEHELEPILTHDYTVAPQGPLRWYAERLKRKYDISTIKSMKGKSKE